MDALAETYLDHDTAIVPVLRKLFGSSAFKHSVGEKVRRPFQDVVATVRVLGIKPDGERRPTGCRRCTGCSTGSATCRWDGSRPNGYPDYADAWRSAGDHAGPVEHARALAAGWWPVSELRVPDMKTCCSGSKLPKTYGALVDVLAKTLVFRKLAAAHRAAVARVRRARRDADTVDANDRCLQDWRFPYLVALILDTPYHGIR